MKFGNEYSVLNEGIFKDAIASIKKRKDKFVYKNKQRALQNSISHTMAINGLGDVCKQLNHELKKLNPTDYKILIPLDNYEKILEEIENERSDADSCPLLAYTSKPMDELDIKSTYYNIWGYKSTELDSDVAGVPEGSYLIFICGAESIADEEYTTRQKWLDDNKHLQEAVTLQEAVSKIQEDDSDTSIFGLPETRKYPMKNESQIKSVIAQFPKVKSEEDKKELAKNIVRRVREENMHSKIRIYPENPLFEYVPSWMRIAVNRALHESSMDGFLQESITDFKNTFDRDVSNALYGIGDVKYGSPVPKYLNESVGVARAGIVWTLLHEDAMCKSLDTSTCIPVVYSDYCPSLSCTDGCNGGLGKESRDLSEGDLSAYYDPSKNKYQAKGMLDNITHVKYACGLAGHHDDYMSGIRELPDDRDITHMWNIYVNGYYNRMINAKDDNERNVWKQRLYDIKWNPEEDPNDQSVRDRNVSAISGMFFSGPLQETHTGDLCFYNNNGNILLTEGIIGDMGKWFVDKKSQMVSETKTMGKKRADNAQYYNKWKGFNSNGKVKMFHKMNSVIEPINNKFSMNELLETIGIKLDGDIFRKYKGEIPVEKMKSVVIAGTFKDPSLGYFKGMVMSHLMNFLVLTDKKDKPLKTGVTVDQAYELMNDKYLGDEVEESVIRDVFVLNAKMLPIIMNTNIKTVGECELEMKTLLTSIDRTIVNNPDMKELLTFKEIFEFVIVNVVDILLQFNDIAILRMDQMDGIYNDTITTMRESVDLVGGQMNEQVLNETIWTMINSHGTVQPLLENLDVKLYGEYFPMLESVGALTSVNNGFKAAGKNARVLLGTEISMFNEMRTKMKEDAEAGNFDKLKIALSTLNTYLFKLTPETARTVLPEIILWGTCTLVCDLIIHHLIPKAGPLSRGFLNTVCSNTIHTLIHVIETALDNQVNAPDADKNIKACRKAIEEVNVRLDDDATDKVSRGLLEFYKVRLNGYIAKLEESKVQAEILEKVAEEKKKKKEAEAKNKSITA